MSQNSTVVEKKQKGRVIWLMGLSGSGKSTLGLRLEQHFKASSGQPVIRIDGDQVRDFYEGDLGYTKEDRIQNVKRILLSAHLLTQVSVTVIVCNTHPFEKLREFARRKIETYIEIYLKRDFESCVRADPKGVYQKNLGQTPLIGKEIPFEEPIQSDLTIDIEATSEDQSFQKILEFLDQPLV